MDATQTRDVRYIKLGRGGRWEALSLEKGEIHFGFAAVPHALAMSADREAIKAHILATTDRDAQAAAEDAREILDFYTLGPDCLWITFAQNHLWWAYAAPEVVWVGGDGSAHGIRMRRTLGGWKNTDANGLPLRMDGLSSWLTQSAGYRRTICRLRAESYLLRRLAGVQEPAVASGGPCPRSWQLPPARRRQARLRSQAAGAPVPHSSPAQPADEALHSYGQTAPQWLAP